MKDLQAIFKRMVICDQEHQIRYIIFSTAQEINTFYLTWLTWHMPPQSKEFLVYNFKMKIHKHKNRNMAVFIV